MGICQSSNHLIDSKGQLDDLIFKFQNKHYASLLEELLVTHFTTN